MENALYIAALEQRLLRVEQERAGLELERDGLKQEREDLLARLERAEAKNAHLLRKLFGARRERYAEQAPHGQLPLPFVPEVEQRADQEVEKKQQAARERERSSRKAHPGRRPFPEHLEVREDHVYPEGDLSGMVEIGTEVTQVLERIPPQTFIWRIVRHTFKVRESGQIFTPALKGLPIERGMVGPKLLAWVLVSKYVNHLPLHRIRQILKRESGLELADSTLEGWVRQAADRLELLRGSLARAALRTGYVQMDETRMPVLDPVQAPGKTHTGQYWVLHSPLTRSPVFFYDPGRSKALPMNLLESYRGYLQVDGYAAYGSAIKGRESITPLYCWAHARRKFFDAKHEDPEAMRQVLTWIQKLYRIEEEARSAGMTAEARKAMRLERALPELTEIGTWAWGHKKHYRPQSDIGKALTYMLERWTGLEVYLYDGQLEIDNNLIENAIRPVALGRKNYLFAGSHEAADRGAVLYTLMSACLREGVDPEVWLAEVLPLILDTKASEIETLLPAAWKARKDAAETSKNDES